MTADDPLVLALPVTVYAVNVRYVVRPEYEARVPTTAKTVFVLHQFPRAGESPLTEAQVLAEAREEIEADLIADGPLAGKNIGTVYTQSGAYSHTSYIVRPHPVSHGKVE